MANAECISKHIMANESKGNVSLTVETGLNFLMFLDKQTNNLFPHITQPSIFSFQYSQCL